ncbi:MAG: flagellar basal body rod protein FlgC [bacterium]
MNDLFSVLKIGSDALNAQKKQLSITAENIANASTTRTSAGTPYKRKFLVKKAISNPPMFPSLLYRARTRLRTANPEHIASARYQPGGGATLGSEELETQVLEKAQFKKIYDPGHPDAGADGFVEYPDINVVMEMLELISTSRAYEANITVMNTAKTLAKRALEI